MTPSEAVRHLEQVARDLDLAVFSLERPAPPEADRAQAQRDRLRRDLEGLRDRIQDLARALEAP
jgi:hypothetical protein